MLYANHAAPGVLSSSLSNDQTATAENRNEIGEKKEKCVLELEIAIGRRRTPFPTSGKATRQNVGGMDQAENLPQPRFCMSLSSSLPGHMILPCHSARMCATAVMSHMMTRKIVRALQMPLIPGLFRASPTWMAARVRPALGKTNCEGVQC